MEQNINLEKLLDILKAKKIVIFFIIMISILLGYIYTSYFIVPEYIATEDLLLIPNEGKISDTELKLDSELISTYVNIAKSSNILKKVKNNLNLNITEEKLAEDIEINSKEDTYVIQIKVYNEDAQTAVNIAKELTNVFIDEVKKIYNLENIGIIDEAELPSSPYNIDYKKYMGIFCILGIVIAGIYIYLIYIFDNTVKEENVEKFTKLKILGKIPINNKNSDELLLEDDTKSYIIENINTIRTNIMYMNSISKVKTILFTSCLQGEGKSWISANIAVAFAKSNKKVLLMDADLRKGRADRIFDVNNDDGLSNYLYAMTGDVKKDVLLCKNYIKETKIPNLHIMTNGTIPPNPSEIISSNYMRELISIFSNAYDIVIIDAPPCKLVSDSIILSTMADSTIIVAKDNKTKIKDVVAAKKAIQVVNGKITGIILNQKKIDDKKYEQSYYGDIGKYKKKELKEENILKVDDIVKELKKSTQKIEKDIIERNNRIENERKNKQKTPKIDKNVKEEEIKFEQYMQKAREALDDLNLKLNKYEVKNKLDERRMNKYINNKIQNKLDDMQERLGEKIKNILKTEINNEEKFQNMDEKIEKEVNLINKNMDEKIEKEVNLINNNMNEKIEEKVNLINNNMDEKTEEKVNLINNNVNEKIEEKVNLISKNMDEKIEEKVNLISNNMNEKTEEKINLINNNINDLKQLNEGKFEKIKEESEIKKEELLKIIEDNNNQMKNSQIEEIHTLIEKNIDEIKNNYEKEITQINDILQSLQNNYSELAKAINTKKEEKKKNNRSNIIDMKSVKRKNKYSIDEDISFYELQKNAAYIIPISHKKSEKIDMDLEEKSFESFIG